MEYPYGERRAAVRPSGWGDHGNSPDACGDAVSKVIWFPVGLGRQKTDSDIAAYRGLKNGVQAVEIDTAEIVSGFIAKFVEGAERRWIRLTECDVTRRFRITQR